MEKRQNIFSVREDDRLVFVVKAVCLNKTNFNLKIDILSKPKEC